MADQARQVTTSGIRRACDCSCTELEQHGVQVQWDQPEGRRNKSGDAREDYVVLDTTGSRQAVRTAVQRVCDEKPAADVRIEDV